MFTSITATPDNGPQEHIPRSSPPWVWVGFVFAVIFFVVAVTGGVMEALGAEAGLVTMINGLLIVIGIISFIYWLFCIHRIHKILAELTNNRYSISPGEAALKHIIPILGVIWLFQWPAELSRYLNERGRVKMISGHAIGAMLLLSVLLRWIDGSFGTVALFGVTMFVSSKLKAHVKALKGATPEQLPPLPDPRIFSRPIETSTTPAPETVERSQVG